MRSSFESQECPPKSKSVSENVLDVAMKVCRQSVMSLDDMIDQKKGFSEGVSDEDWAVIGASEPKMQSLAEI